MVNAQVPIRIDKGWKHIGNIKIGDMVLTHKLRYRPVSELIFTPLQRPMIVRLFFKRKQEIFYGSGVFDETVNHFLTLTENRLVVVNGGWLAAKFIKTGDKVSILANRCKRCGKLLPYSYAYCSVTCRQLDTTDRQYLNQEKGGRLASRYEHLKIKLKFEPPKVKFDVGRLEFIEMTISNMEHRLLGKVHRLYNFFVEEDESYIAKGFVVHARVGSLKQRTSLLEL